MVNEPSVFELLRFDCTHASAVGWKPIFYAIKSGQHPLSAFWFLLNCYKVTLLLKCCSVHACFEAILTPSKFFWPPLVGFMMTKPYGPTRVSYKVNDVESDRTVRTGGSLMLRVIRVYVHTLQGKLYFESLHESSSMSRAVLPRHTYITKTRLYNFDSLKPHFYTVKLGFTGVYIIFLISVQKHRLWVFVRTASARRF